MIIRLFVLLLLALSGLKVLAVFYTNFDLFGDEAQYWLWAQNLDLGYFSKPPLIAWILSAYTFVFGSSFESIKFFPIIFYFFSSVPFYRLCKKIGLAKDSALFVSLSFLLIPAVTVSSFLISTDVLLIFFWIMCLNILLDIRKNPDYFNFIILGVFLGLAFLSKYAAIYFFVCLVVFIIFDNKIKNIIYLNKFKAFVFLVIFFVVIFPNVMWNLNNGWLTLKHTSSNANWQNMNINLYRGIEFIFIQIVMVGPVVFVGMLLNIKNIKFDFENIFLLSFSIPIFIIIFMQSIIVNANANWAAVGLISLYLFFISSSLRFNYIIILNYLFNFVFAFCFFFLILNTYNLSLFDRINGINNFSVELKNLINDKKYIVISDRLLYSSMSYELRNDKEVGFLMPLKNNEKITKHFQISNPLKKDIKKDFLYIGVISEIEYLVNKKNIELIKEIDVKFLSSKINIYEVKFD